MHLAGVAGLQFVAVNALSLLFLSLNLSRGVYPVDADSISIPLFDILVFTLFGLLLQAIAIVLPRKPCVLRWLSVLLCALASAGMGLLAVAWADPQHWPIAATCVLAMGGTGFIAYAILRACAGLLPPPAQLHAQA